MRNTCLALISVCFLGCAREVSISARVSEIEPPETPHQMWIASAADKVEPDARPDIAPYVLSAVRPEVLVPISSEREIDTGRGDAAWAALAKDMRSALRAADDNSAFDRWLEGGNYDGRTFIISECDACGGENAECPRCYGALVQAEPGWDGEGGSFTIAEVVASCSTEIDQKIELSPEDE